MLFKDQGWYSHLNPIRNHGDHPTQRGGHRPPSRFGLRPTRLVARLTTYTTCWDAILPRSGPAEHTIAWLQRIASTTGRADTTSAEVSAQLQRFISIRRQQSKDADRGIHAMTVHQAKNREFDGVVVIWPFEFKADDEGKRRLLYNAVTRARRWCSVIVQSDKMLKSPPFS